MNHKPYALHPELHPEQGPVGSEVTYGMGGQVPHDLDYLFTEGEDNSTRPKFAWGDVGMGDGFEDAQSIVGQRGGGRDTKYQYHYMDTANDKDAQRIAGEYGAGESGEGDHMKYYRIPNDRYPLDRLVYQVGGVADGWGGVHDARVVPALLSLSLLCPSPSLSLLLFRCLCLSSLSLALCLSFCLYVDLSFSPPPPPTSLSICPPPTRAMPAVAAASCASGTRARAAQ